MRVELVNLNNSESAAHALDEALRIIRDAEIDDDALKVRAFDLVFQAITQRVAFPVQDLPVKFVRPGDLR